MAWGRAYEGRVATYLDAIFEGVIRQPWYEYRDYDGLFLCSPDLLIIPEDDDTCLLLAEVKLTTTEDAEAELRGLYLPVIQHIYPDADIRLLQISMNLSTDWDGPVVDNLDTVYEDANWEFGTLQLRRLPK